MKRVVAALILKDDQILACQRTRHQPMPLKWEFPGGKIEEGEQPRDALRRELEEELGIEATIGNEVARIHHETLAAARSNCVSLKCTIMRAKLKTEFFGKSGGSTAANYRNWTSWKPIWGWLRI